MSHAIGAPAGGAATCKEGGRTVPCGPCRALWCATPLPRPSDPQAKADPAFGQSEGGASSLFWAQLHGDAALKALLLQGHDATDDALAPVQGALERVTSTMHGASMEVQGWMRESMHSVSEGARRRVEARARDGPSSAVAERHNDGVEAPRAGYVLADGYAPAVTFMEWVLHDLAAEWEQFADDSPSLPAVLAQARVFVIERVARGAAQPIEDMLAVYIYTYECDLYRLVNRALRSGSGAALEAWLPYVHYLSKALEGLPLVEDGTQTWRGVGRKFDLAEYAPGKEVVWAAFSRYGSFAPRGTHGPTPPQICGRLRRPRQVGLPICWILPILPICSADSLDFANFADLFCRFVGFLGFYRFVMPFPEPP